MEIWNFQCTQVQRDDIDIKFNIYKDDRDKSDVNFKFSIFI